MFIGSSVVIDISVGQELVEATALLGAQTL